MTKFKKNKYYVKRIKKVKRNKFNKIIRIKNKNSKSKIKKKRRIKLRIKVKKTFKKIMMTFLIQLNLKQPMVAK